MNNRRLEEKARSATGIAACFDLDGTLVARPSLERRFFATLRYQRAIPLRNYWRWIREALRLAPRGLAQATKANKMYLRGSAANRVGAGWFYEPTFFSEAVARAAWHAKQGHLLVLVSGTLQPLAERVARALEEELRVHGVSGMQGAIRVCATRLEQTSGYWTGRIVGEAMLGDAKARAVEQLAEQLQLDLAKCFAYGDSADDRWLLQAVGNPGAVNPSKELKRIADERGWISFHWNTSRISAQRENREQKTRRRQ